MRPDQFARQSEMTPPVVVVGGDEVALGIVRDLGRERVPVLAMGPDRRGPALHSRYCTSRPCADPHYDEQGLVENLEAVGTMLPQHAVLFPAHDDYVFAVSRHKARLEASFIVPVMPWERMRMLADKEQQLRLAWRAGVDTPITGFVHGPDDLAAAADAVPFPAVLKPATPLAFVRQAGFKAVQVQSRAQLEDTYNHCSFAGSLLLQELIPGDDADIYIAGTYHDAQSHCVARFTGRKLRQHPRGFGVTRLGESRWSSELADLTDRLLTAVSYEGVSDVEFRRDPRDGRLKLIEVNARQGYWTPLATASGVNLTYIAYRDAGGRPCPGSWQRDGVRWSDILRDGPDSFAEVRRGEMSIRQWLEPLTGVRSDAYLSLRDPRPGLLESGRLAARLMKRRSQGRVHESA